MAMMNEEKWKELEQNAELKAELEAADSPEKAHEILVRHGADVTLEEVQGMIQKEDALSETDLEEVAGGVRRPIFGGFRLVIYFNPFRVVILRC